MQAFCSPSLLWPALSQLGSGVSWGHFFKRMAMQESDQEIICSLSMDFYGESRYLIDEGMDPQHIMSALASVLVHMTEVHDNAAQDAADLIEHAVMMGRAGTWHNG